jgi:integrase
MSSIYYWDSRETFMYAYREGGKQKTINLKTKDKKEAKSKQRKYDIELEDNKEVFNIGKSGCAQALEEYLIIQRLDHSKGHADDVQRKVKAFLSHSGVLQLKDITNLHIVKFLSSYKESKLKNGKPISPSSYKNMVAVVNAWLNWCVEEKKLKESPSDVKATRVQTNRKPIPPEAVGKALAVAQEYKAFHHLYPALVCAVYTGMRLGDVGRLTWANVCGSEIVIPNTKTGGTFKAPIHDDLRKVLDELPNGAENDLLFDITNHEKLMVEIFEKAGITQRGKWHLFRHTFASRLFEMGVDLATVSELLGHSNIRTTADIYLHTNPARKKQAIAALPSFASK